MQKYARVMKMSEWLEKQIKKETRRWKKRPQIYVALIISVGFAIFLGIIGLAILWRPTVDSNGNTLHYDIPNSTGFYILILSMGWTVVTLIIYAYVNMLVEKESAD